MRHNLPLFSSPGTRATDRLRQPLARAGRQHQEQGQAGCAHGPCLPQRQGRYRSRAGRLRYRVRRVAERTVDGCCWTLVGLRERPGECEPQSGYTPSDRLHLRVTTKRACSLHYVYQPITSHSLQKPEILSMRSNEILTAVIHGARKEEPSQDVQLAAIQALLNSLEFVRDNFEREVRHHT